jgi:hypothetical protein
MASLGLATAGPAGAQTYALDLVGGSAYNFPTPLKVHQSGYPDINLTARYDTKPLGPKAPYFALRLGRWEGDAAWEIQHLHHRLYLANPPADIQFFAIHYGYNYILLGRAWKRDGLVFHLGVGPILTNPETTVRHQSRPVGSWFLNGWYFSGLGMEAAVEKRYYLKTQTYLVAEAALTTGFAWTVPIAAGSANVRNVALHGQIGFGHSF